MKNLSIILLIAAMASASAKDVITLRNHHNFEGEIVRISNCTVHFRSAGHRYHIPAADIETIRFEDPANPIYTSYLQLAAAEENPCMKGSMDAKAFHGKAGLHVTLGVLFGPFAVIGAAVGNPDPMNGSRTTELSKNSALFQDPQYLECYRKAARGRNTGSTAAGWALGILLLLVI